MDDAAYGGADFVSVHRIGSGLGQLADQLGIARAGHWQGRDGRRRGFGQPGLQFRLLPFQVFQPGHQRPRRLIAVNQDVQGPLDLPLDLCEILFGVHARAVALRSGFLLVPLPFIPGGFERAGAAQQGLQGGEDPRLDLARHDASLFRAGAALAPVGAAIPVLRDDVHRPAACAADKQAGQGAGGPAALPAGFAAHIGLHGFGRFPLVIGEDAKVRDGFRDPFGFRIGPVAFLAGGGICHLAATVPDAAPDIEFIVEDAIAMLALAADRGGLPEAAARTSDRAGVEVSGQCAGAGAGGEAFVDLAHNRGLSLIDHQIARLRAEAVTEGQPASGVSGLDAPAQAAPRLGGKFGQEHGIHQAFEADMQRRDLLFRQGHDAHLGKGKGAVNYGGVGLVPAEAVEGFGHHHVKGASRRIGQQGLQAGPRQHAGGADRLIRVEPGLAPAAPGEVFAQQRELVGNRPGLLKIAAVSGVKGDSGQFGDSCCSSVSGGRRTFT